ncbi:MAG TPA: S8 family serine peptidase [Draconibacterium sp.]|nr:S8 family serine peptidase [Draconibacterium sp.]
MKRSTLTLFFVFFLMLSTTAQNYFRIAFTDKNNSPFTLDHPEDYLSERAIQRRVNQNIEIDSLDLPVNQNYIDSVLTLDVSFVHASKWLNEITVATSYETIDFILSWSFVKEIQLTKPGVMTKSAHHKFAEEQITESLPIDTSLYGASVYQVGMLNGQFLHEKGYRGEGIQIAVLDAGFEKADQLPAFDSLWLNGQILGTRDFVTPDSDFWSTDSHGMSVLSTMGGNIPGQLIGTAPEASYLLLRSEDKATEYIIEEDNWAVAAEYADSAGVDVINSSLGYYTFNDPSTDHTYADMDGKTTRVTQAANITASRGILVFASAGNERDKDWFRIIAPSDGTNVIGVGAVDKNMVPASFTSAGPAYGGAIKPNVAAMGYLTAAQLTNGNVGLVRGTSFSSPVMAGMAASLWSMFPEKTAVEIKEAIERSASQYNSPDSLLGYGIPDMKIASELLGYNSTENIETLSSWKVFPNPVKDQLVIWALLTPTQNVQIELYSLQGNVLKRWIKSAGQKIILNDLPALTTGMYVLRINNGSANESFKINVVK